jgi:hypothetical protein
MSSPYDNYKAFCYPDDNDWRDKPMSGRTDKTVSEMETDRLADTVLDVYDKCTRHTNDQEMAVQLCALVCAVRYGDSGSMAQEVMRIMIKAFGKK